MGLGGSLPPKVNGLAGSLAAVPAPENENEGLAGSVEPKPEETGFTASVVPEPKEKGFGSSGFLVSNENDAVAADDSADLPLSPPKLKVGAAGFSVAASGFAAPKLKPEVAPPVLPNEKDGFGASAGFSSLFSAGLDPPKENVGGSVFSSVLDAPNVKLEVAAGFDSEDAPNVKLGALFSSVFSAEAPKIGAAAGVVPFSSVLDAPKLKPEAAGVEGAPKENFGASFGSSGFTSFGGLGFGDSHAEHLKGYFVISLTTQQISQVQVPAEAFFCFAMKSPKPLVTGGTTGAAGTSVSALAPKENFGGSGAAGTGGFGALGLGDSHAEHFNASLSFQTQQISHCHLPADSFFCLAIKSAKPPLKRGFD